MNIFLISLRTILFSAFAALVNYFIDSGSPYWVASAGAGAGVIGAYLLARKKLNLVGFIAVCGAMFFMQRIFFETIESLFPELTSEAFAPYQLEQHVLIFLLNFYGAGAVTWFFCRIKGFATLEIVGFLTLVVSVLSGHRNFHFETPKIFNSLAWDLGVNPLTIFIASGCAASILAITYAFGSVRYTAFGATAVPRVKAGGRGTGRAVGAVAFFIGALYLICSYLYGTFHAVQLVRTTNGVGLERSPGLSPLGFHSALGSTNQPAALVRLDGDYQKNPFSPMIYLRENALSQFNGKEIVMAERLYDRDVTSTAPDERFVGEEDPALTGRTQLSLSAYLLTNHNTAFAVDYPLSITPIKNPNPQRFRGAFKAVSLVPQYVLSDLAFDQVGDHRWTPETWNHYLQVHPDTRYKEMAEKLAVGQMTNIQKASAIVQYLSENAIYTLTPNHSLGAPDADPVAPFLFGDMRGYCVHFAHATVYMLRALGIPARIGTGYLTDLSQSKDGHILLRMSDRHAWAEVYVEGKGWVPFDTKPQHVESHAETKVDMKLLEELMGMIGPDELVLPKDVAKDEPGARETPSDFEFETPNLAPYMLAVLGLIILSKLWVRWSWLLPGRESSVLRRAYRASVSYCYDLGHLRDFGETKEEYRLRIRDELGLPLLSLTDAVVTGQYRSASPTVSASVIRASLKKERALRKSLSWGRKVLAVFNPTSLLTLLRRRW